MAGKHAAPATELAKALDAAADGFGVFVGQEYLWRRATGSDLPVVVTGYRLYFPTKARGKARGRVIARVPSLSNATVELRLDRLQKVVETDA